MTLYGRNELLEAFRRSADGLKADLTLRSPEPIEGARVMLNVDGLVGNMFWEGRQLFETKMSTPSADDGLDLDMALVWKVARTLYRAYEFSPDVPAETVADAAGVSVITAMELVRGSSELLRRPPDWIGQFEEYVHPAIERQLGAPPDWPTVEASWEPFLHARSFVTHNRIEVSHFTRDFFHFVNSHLAELISRISDEDGTPVPIAVYGTDRYFEEFMPVFADIIAETAGFALKKPSSTRHQIFCSHEAMDRAYKTTQSQLFFMLAHEYGHILEEEVHEGLNTDNAQMKEDAADLFAFQVLHDAQDNWEDAWVSIYWLYATVRLYFVIAGINAGGSTETAEAEFLRRTRALYEMSLGIAVPSWAIRRAKSGSAALRMCERIVRSSPAQLDDLRHVVARNQRFLIPKWLTATDDEQ